MASSTFVVALLSTLSPGMRGHWMECDRLRASASRWGTSYRVFWRTSEGLQRTRTFTSKTEAREWRATVEQLEAAGQAPDPTRGNISLDAWAAQVLATLHLKPKTAETYASLLRSRILPTFGQQPIGAISRAQDRTWVAGMAGEVTAMIDDAGAGTGRGCRRLSPRDVPSWNLSTRLMAPSLVVDLAQSA